MLGFALRRVGPDDATDIVAETFLVAWRRLDDVPDGDAARLWLLEPRAARVAVARDSAGRILERRVPAWNGNPTGDPDGPPPPASP